MDLSTASTAQATLSHLYSKSEIRNILRNAHKYEEDVNDLTELDVLLNGYSTNFDLHGWSRIYNYTNEPSSGVCVGMSSN